MSEHNGQHLPPGWCRARVGDIANYINGAAFKPADWEAEGVPIIRIQNLTDPLKPCNRTKRQIDQRLLIRQGDLLFSWSATLDAFLWHGEDAWLNQHIFKVEPEGRIQTRFLFYLLRHVVREILRSEHMHGSTMRHINRGPFLSYYVSLPPLMEQGAITDALDELFSDLDAAVVALERAQAKLKHYRAAVLKAAVEGALTAEWREQHRATEPASELLDRILAERRRRWEEAQLRKFKVAGKEPPKNWKAKYQEPATPDRSKLPPLPESWCWVRLGQLLLEIEAGKSFDCVPRPASADEWGIIKVSAMSWGTFDETENKTVPPGRVVDPHYEIKPGDILLSRANTYELVGASVLVNQCRPRLLLSDKSMRLLHSPSVDKFWLKTVLSSPWVRGQLSRKSTGTKEGMRNVSQESVLDVVVPLAPAAECLALVEAVEDQLSVIDHLDTDLNAKLKSAQTLRQSILRHAFTGKLVPQDPNDEPASELLKRIAADRAERQRLVAAPKKVGRARRARRLA